AGLHLGESIADKRNRVGTAAPIEELAALLPIFAERGYGFATIESAPADDCARVRCDESPEAASARSSRARNSQPVCRFLSGLLAGAWLRLLDASGAQALGVECWEVECRAAGGKSCRFEIGPAASLKALGAASKSPPEPARWQLLALSRSLDESRREISELDVRLRQRAAAYENLLDHMNDLLVVVDREKRLAFCNRRLLELTRRTLPELTGRRASEWVAPADRDALDAAFDRLLVGETAADTCTFRTQAPDGIRYFQASMRVLPGPDGPVGIEALARDVTDSELTRQDAAAAHAGLEAAHRETMRRQRAIDRDLRMAKFVHESLLPAPQRRPEIAVHFRFLPADRIGGDYVNISYPRVAGRQYGLIAVCDVSGHGPAAALLAGRVDSQIRFWTQSLADAEAAPDPTALAVALHGFLRRHFAETGLFVTAWIGAIDLADHQLVWCGAGHPPGYLAREGGAIEELESQHLPLGASEDFLLDDPPGKTRFAPGDRLLLYTDGATDSVGPSGGRDGSAGLRRAVATSLPLTAEEACASILAATVGFAVGPPPDDICLVVVEPLDGEDDDAASSG
ncbi:MAG TPA: SpoIIE family protein phosphatase, partial [Planctomycetia bacterium]|nr:SpoIIE family protein phosphatase [Planctomycetia bacterium]